MQTSVATDLRVLLTDESAHDYGKHVTGLMTSFQPADYYEELLVHEFADAAWAWRRARAVETAHLHHVGTSYYRGPQGIAEALFHVPDKHFRNHYRFMLDAERRYEHARRAVEDIRRHRERAIAATPPIAVEPPPAGTATIAFEAAPRTATAKKRNEPTAAAARPTAGWREPGVRNEPNRPPRMTPPERRVGQAVRPLLEVMENKADGKAVWPTP